MIVKSDVGRLPPWWRRVAFAWTKQVYHAGPKPVIYIVPAQLILGRLALVPVGEDGTIPHSLHSNSSALGVSLAREMANATLWCGPGRSATQIQSSTRFLCAHASAEICFCDNVSQGDYWSNSFELRWHA